MNTEEMKRLSEQLQGELTGEPDRDRELLLTWAERFRGDDTAQPLLREIGRLLFRLDEETTLPLTEQVMDEVLQRGEVALAQAEERLAEGEFAQAEAILAPVLEEIDSVFLPEDAVWMDFNSFLDGLLYQDLFREEIGDREVRRHPLHPAGLLYTCAMAQLEQGKIGQARETLERLLRLDPVCPEYLCALANTCLSENALEDSWEALRWALLCASTREEAACCYNLLALCCAAEGKRSDAALLLQKSLRVLPLPEVEEALTQLAEQAEAGKDLSDEEINRRCQALDIPTGRSEVVEKNLDFLSSLSF